MGRAAALREQLTARRLCVGAWVRPRRSGGMLTARRSLRGREAAQVTAMRQRQLRHQQRWHSQSPPTLYNQCSHSAAAQQHRISG